MSVYRRLFILLGCLVAAKAAFAHDPGLSSAHLKRVGPGLEVTLDFSWTDLVSVASAVPGSARPSEEKLQALAPVLAQVPGGLVRIYSNDNPIETPGLVVSSGPSGPQDVLVTIRWSEIPDTALRVEFPVLASMPFGHRMMLRLEDGVQPVALMDARNKSWAVPVAVTENRRMPSSVETQPERVSWSSFVLLGIEHILTGFDHLCFLLALLLVATSLRDVLMVVTTFTVAHSLTLAAAAFGAVSISPSVVEPLIAVSIIYIGLENLFLKRQPRHRLAVVFAFGLIHGLGFADALAERLPGITGWSVVPPLLGFNGGVELGQLAVAAALVPLIKLARTRANFPNRLQPACSFAIATAGVIWLLQRI